MTVVPSWDDEMLEMTCDTCGYAEEFNMVGSFQSAIDAAKADGWKIRPDQDVSGGWRHTCPECQARKNEAMIFNDKDDFNPGWIPKH